MPILSSDPDFIIQVENIKKIMAGGNIPRVLRIVAQRFPVIFRSPLSKNAKIRFQSLRDFIIQQVDEHDRTFQGDDIRDIVDSFLAECRRLQEKGEQECYIRKEDIWMSVWDLFIAGTETTASALAWFFLFMAAHPDIQEQVSTHKNKLTLSQRINYVMSCSLRQLDSQSQDNVKEAYLTGHMVL